MAYSQDSLYQSLLIITNILVREVTPDGLFSSLAKTLQPMVGCDRCSLSIYDAETDSLSWFAQAEGVSVTRMDAEVAPLRGPLAREAIRKLAPVIIPRLETYARNEAVQLMLEVGLRSSMAFPLLSRGKPIGAIVVSFMRYLGEDDAPLSGFLSKISAQVALAVDNMLIHAKLNKKNEELHRQVDTLLSAEDTLHAGSRFFYECPSMQNLMTQVRLLARSDAPVLICGETGTGKELVARFIHQASARRTYNFVKVNCPALASTLFESELFGHAKGAFTGASSSRMGRFELADKGSIFLDEIGDLALALQAKLLHVLQDAKLERVGESRSIPVDVRCISATNADLPQMIREGRFRRDLFYRLGVTTVQLPPLRDRQGEVGPLLMHLMHVHAQAARCAPATLHPDALKMLEDYHWPGNVRELSNLLARLLILHPGSEIGPEHIMPLLEQSGDFHEEDAFARPAAAFERIAATEPQSSLASAEKAHIEKVLTLTGGKISGRGGAAALLRIPRSTLQYKLKKHNLEPRKFYKKP